MRASVILVVLSFAVSAMCEGTSGLRIIHFPDAAYRDERIAFVVESHAGDAFSVRLDDYRLVKAVATTNVLELNFAIPRSGRLSFHRGKESRAFQVVRPTNDVALVEKDGYLYANDLPAVLLAEHRHIPKHDRRWETVSLLRSLFRDTRPDVHSAIVVGADFLSTNDAVRIDEFAGGDGLWTHVGIDGEGGLNDLAVAIRSLPPSDVVVLALSDRDLERGIGDLQFETKLAWCMQAIDRTKCAHLFLAGPPLDSDQRKRFPGLFRAANIWARSHDARFIKPGDRKAGSAINGSSWMKRIANGVADTVRLRPVMVEETAK